MNYDTGRDDFEGASEAPVPTGDEQFWRTHFENELSRLPGMEYADYAPAYRFGYDQREHLFSDSFEQVEAHLARQWNAARGASRLDWYGARQAVRAAWNHRDLTS